jgi:hypothetical protein
MKADKVTYALGQFQGKELIQPQMTLGSGYIQANAGNCYIRERTSAIPINGLFVNTTPTVGTWKRGQAVWRVGATAGSAPGQVCVLAGTPGTWKDMANLAP